MKIRPGFAAALAASCLFSFFFSPGVASAVTLAEIDTFDPYSASNREGWTGGPAVTPTALGGVDNSAFLRVSRTLPGSLGIYNQSQWFGDYLTAGIGGIQMSLNNFLVTGAQELRLRIMIVADPADAGGNNWTSINPIIIAPNSGWQTHVFGLSAADLMYTGSGTPDLNAALSSVQRLLIRHDPAGLGVTEPPAAVIATLGVDNIMAVAVPEPGRGLLLTLGAFSAMWVRRRRR